jgi:hypothetical protein
MVPKVVQAARVEKYAVVALFTTLFDGAEMAVLACSECSMFAQDIMLYRGSTSTRPGSEAPALCRCVHMGLAIAEVLSAAGIFQKRFVEGDLQRTLVGLCQAAAPASISAVYSTPLPPIFPNKFHVVVTSTWQLHLFRQHGTTWFCPKCRKYGRNGCGHLSQCTPMLATIPLLETTPEDNVAADPAPSSADQDFRKHYLVSNTKYDCMAHEFSSCAGIGLTDAVT